jgi:hypothetical protein
VGAPLLNLAYAHLTEEHSVVEENMWSIFTKVPWRVVEVEFPEYRIFERAKETPA